MHAPGSLAVVGIKIFLLCATIAETYPITGITYRNLDLPKRCCAAEYAFNEDLECVRKRAEPDKPDYTTRDVWRTVSSQQPRRIVTVIALVQGISCVDDAGASNRHFLQTYAGDSYVPREHCIERMINGTLVLAKCPDSGADLVATEEDESAGTITIKTTISAVTTIATNVTSSREDENRVSKCYEDTHILMIWRKISHSHVSMAVAILCTIVIVIYLCVPELGKSIYNHAVLCHNICLLLAECFLLLPYLCGSCRCPIGFDGEESIVFQWVAMQYFINATGFWLNVICFDMTVSITRFRWTADPSQRIQEKNRRLLMYSIFAWGGGLISVVIALFFQYCPGIPEDFPLRPNYPLTAVVPGIAVYCYFFGLSLLAFFCNNVLFLFTICKIMRIQWNTKIATRSRNDVFRKRHCLYLELYLVMGSPWFFGTLFSFWKYPIVIRVCRVMQPTVWLLELAVRKKLRRKLANRLRCVKRREVDAVVS